VKRFEELGVTVQKMSPAEFAALVDKQVRDWAPAIKAADLR
jgi:tripartite-type tricarboxylate transporter receptor subunit TctC